MKQHTRELVAVNAERALDENIPNSGTDAILARLFSDGQEIVDARRSLEQTRIKQAREMEDRVRAAAVAPARARYSYD